jgi:hypothetical protein
MSELSTKVKKLRGDKSPVEAAEMCDLSRESFYRIERGGSVKLETLRSIAKGFKLSEPDWLDLLASWLRHEAGPDEVKLWIESKQGESQLNDSESDEIGKAMILFKGLNHIDRKEVLKAMDRKEVRDCLPSINNCWEKFS